MGMVVFVFAIIIIIIITTTTIIIIAVITTTTTTIIIVVIIIIIIEGYSSFTTALHPGVPLLQTAYVDSGLFK
jgi:hypothetical protein